MTLSHISEVIPEVLPPRHQTLDDLIDRFRAQEALDNADTVAPMNKLWMMNDGTIALPGMNGPFAFTDWSKNQLASIVGVRWDRWFANMSQEDQAAEINKRLWSSSARIRVRTARSEEKTNGTAGIVRALVSPTFSPLPDSDLLGLLKDALEPVKPELRVVRSFVTDRSTSYAIGIGRPFRPGDDHEVGDVWGCLSIRNSGVGYAAAVVVASLTRLLCKNGMQAPIPDALLLRRAHRAFDLGKLRETLVERLRELPGKL